MSASRAPPHEKADVVINLLIQLDRVQINLCHRELMEFMRSEILSLNLPITDVSGSFASQQTGLHIAGLIYGFDPGSKIQCVDELI